MRGYKAGRFSFNVKGGRCEACQGQGQVQIEMQFLPDIYVPCDVCHGARFNRETLQVRFKGKNIAEVLDTSDRRGGGRSSTHIPAIKRKLETLQAVGLGYIKHRPAGHDALAAARPSASSWPRSSRSAPPAARCTCWTSRRWACTPPTCTS